MRRVGIRQIPHGLKKVYTLQLIKPVYNIGMENLTFDIIYNPVSSGGKSLKVFEEVLSELDRRGINYVVHKTSYAGETTEIVKKLNKEQDDTKAIILGGDGTFGEALMGITDFNTIALGLIPCGTGNDYARAMRFPKETKEFIDQFTKCETRTTDFIEVNDKRCLNVCGMGMDVDILERYAVTKGVKGKLKYYAALFWVVAHLKFHKIRYTIGEESGEREVVITSIANGQFIGGGMNMSPNSIIGDGKFNVIMIDRFKRGQKIPLLLSFLKGKHLTRPETREFWADEFDIEILDDGKFQMDGELFDFKKIHCKLIHGKLRLLN